MLSVDELQMYVSDHPAEADSVRHHREQYQPFREASEMSHSRRVLRVLILAAIRDAKAARERAALGCRV